MKKKPGRKEKVLLILILLEFLAAGYDVFWNESRIIHPIDFSVYQFRISDLPLILATILLAVYVVGIVCVRIGEVFKNAGNSGKEQARVTRKLSSVYGWFGLFGVVGFLGIPSYISQHQVWPFFFFVFFGFFGFFYEARMSETLMDECFKEEQKRAQLTAYKTGFLLLWIVTWAVAMLGSRLNAEIVALIFSITSPLIIAFVFFLNHYLLYKFDREGVE